MQTSLLITGLLLSALLLACTATADVPDGMAKATFAVHCYDVGVNALSGKPGVLSVQRGWSGTKEVDRVVYNPEEVTLMQLEDWLKEADTYISTLEHTLPAMPQKEMMK